MSANLTALPLPGQNEPKIRLIGLPQADLGNGLPTSSLVRKVFALLAMNAGQYVSVPRLIDELWGTPPTTVKPLLQTYIFDLRKALQQKEIIQTKGNAYMLLVEADEVDVLRFQRLVDHVRANVTTTDAVHLQHLQQATEEALALVRGPFMDGVERGPELSEAVDRLEDYHETALWYRHEIGLRLGLHREILDSLRATWRTKPWEEDVASLLMLAFYRCRRVDEATAVFRATRRALREELGLEPTPKTQQLFQQILRGDLPLQQDLGRLP